MVTTNYQHGKTPHQTFGTKYNSSTLCSILRQSETQKSKNFKRNKMLSAHIVDSPQTEWAAAIGSVYLSFIWLLKIVGSTFCQPFNLYKSPPNIFDNVAGRCIGVYSTWKFYLNGHATFYTWFRSSLVMFNEKWWIIVSPSTKRKSSIISTKRRRPIRA